MSDTFYPDDDAILSAAKDGTLFEVCDGETCHYEIGGRVVAGRPILFLFALGSLLYEAVPAQPDDQPRTSKIISA